VDGRRRERTPTSSLNLFLSLSLPNYYTERRDDFARSLTSIALSELLFRISHDVNPRETLPLERLGVLLD
jgi:hypothetical protein